MKETHIIMGMPVTLEVVDPHASEGVMDSIFTYFTSIDERFSTYKDSSEISRINHDNLPKTEWSAEMREVFALAEETLRATDGYFDIRKPDGTYDPSGIVKGWAIWNAAQRLMDGGFKNFCLDVGGDIQTSGTKGNGEEWSVGIRNPFAKNEVVKVIYPRGKGVATSGTYIRGDHIWNPHRPARPITDIVCITVIGENVYEADRFATAAFAMGREGIDFIERVPGLEGYQISRDGIALMSSGFHAYTTTHAHVH